MNKTDEATFVAFVESSSPALLRTAWFLTGDRHLAEELVQESYERAYVTWRRISTGSPYGYVRRTLVNLHTDRWRRRHGEVAMAALPERAAPSVQTASDDRDQIVRLLQTLPKREREVVVLRYYANLSEQETADTLGVSVGTVKSSASRGLAALRDALNSNSEVKR
ncbi:SigE family RNA polymerase sigma factor [Calidifontibacter sp. DB0510]|uniref:SigE family RNA polymerase sigma factor n=1 Tax=Metallococcus carri TaxID=1656884 RepID=A0A967B1B9_9MICO|nr:SigE family RNA polymerase sigma factor [Metallococcus carri]NHN55595.1 SigE family RNA polymerase sigma factor [Metallococcus carri]NOP38221.1 SigE family RNA polymerase sigma factor [Calidifontibacter sp. DB2511S]